SSADTAEKLRLQQEQNKASRKQAGTEYELMVAEKLLSEFSDWTSTGRAHLLYDVKIPNTQIDILLIDTSGIYIIECKRWKGLIVGKHSWPVWFQIDCKIVNNKPDVESPTYNADKYVSCKILPAPVEQNEIHMKKLQDFICDSGIREDLKFKRLSVMNSTGYLDFIQKDTDTQKNWIKNYIWLGKDEDIVSAIQDYDCRTLEATRMKPEQVEAIYQLLKPYAAAHDE
ncbi:MAG: nuclease-related domain-containing protein, partial [Angelakisella sp.]